MHESDISSDDCYLDIEHKHQDDIFKVKKHYGFQDLIDYYER
jgi:hypothetical protein